MTRKPEFIYKANDIPCSIGGDCYMSYFDATREFGHALEQIQATYGLSLLLIEKVQLRQLVAAAVSERSLLQYDSNKFNPCAEGITRFLMDYYGLPFDLANVHMSRSSELGHWFMADAQLIRERLQQMQYREHNSLAFAPMRQ